MTNIFCKWNANKELVTRKTIDYLQSPFPKQNNVAMSGWSASEEDDHCILFFRVTEID